MNIKLQISVPFLFTVIIAFFTYVIPHAAHADWEQLSGPYSGTIYSFGGPVYSLGESGLHVFAGTKGGIYLSNDGGYTWLPSDSGLVVNQYVSAFAFAGDTVFAGTYGDGVYRSTDFGTTWIPVNNGLSEVFVFALASFGGKIYAGTDGLGVFVSTDAGASWNMADSGLSSAEINVVYSFAISEGSIFAGTYGGGVYRSSNNGVDWFATGLVGRNVLSLAESGTNIYAGTDSGVYVSLDAGMSWSRGGIANRKIRSVIVSGANIVAATDSGVFISQLNGSTWSAADTGLKDRNTLSLVLSDGNIFLGTDSGSVYLSTNNGFSWIVSNAEPTYYTIYSLAFIAANIYAGTDNGIYLSSDDGANWTNTALSLQDVTSLQKSGSNLFAVTGANNNGSSGGIYISKDSGATWSSIWINAAAGGAITSNVYALAISGAALYAGTNNGVYTSTDTGAHWTAIDSGLTDSYIYSFAVLDGTLFAGSDVGMFTSTNNGALWNTDGLENQWVLSLSVSGRNLLAGTFSGGIFLTFVEDTGWTRVDSALINNPIPNYSEFGSNVFACTGGLYNGNGGIFLSTDNGANWSYQSVGVNGAPVLSSAIAGGYLYAGMTSDGIWRRPLSEIGTSVNEQATVMSANNMFVQNYPNPFGTRTTFTFTLPTSGTAVLNIYNAFGEEVATLFGGEQSIGLHNVEFNGANLQDGIYFYRLTAGQYSQTGKMTVVK